MAKCIKITRTSKRVCIGSLNKRIKILLRAIQPPSSGGVDFSEEFTQEREVWAMIETVDGVTIFDETNVEQIVTHNVYIRYITGMTPEKWVNLLSVNGGDDVLLNILRVENFGENNRFYRMRCNLRGRDDLQANFA